MKEKEKKAIVASISLNKDYFEKINKIQDNTNFSFSLIVRLALDEYFKKNKIKNV